MTCHQTEPNLVREDGTLWASGYDPLDRAWRFFAFWRMVRNPRKKRFTPWRPEWVSTGEIWKGKSLGEGGFRIIR